MCVCVCVNICACDMLARQMHIVFVRMFLSAKQVHTQACACEVGGGAGGDTC